MNEYTRELLKKLKILIDNCLENDILDDDAAHEILELARALMRAKEAEAELYAGKVMKLFLDGVSS